MADLKDYRDLSIEDLAHQLSAAIEYGLEMEAARDTLKLIALESIHLSDNLARRNDVLTETVRRLRDEARAATKGRAILPPLTVPVESSPSSSMCVQ